MAKPAILAVDDDVAVVGAVVRDLRQRYGEDYRVLRDEAEALVSVEPLDGALSHDLFLCSLSATTCRRAAEDIHPC